jgi:demethylmenaquinone methyltransferase / 2-methoxy-6-polyprenyl-1,4-benzoquinol methylase
MTNFAHDTVVPDKNSDSSKKQQVAAMFDDIAFKYDFLNRFLSAGIDIGWRKKAIRQLVDLQPKKILDVATGTADVAIMTTGILKADKIIGIDISDNSFDAVTVAFGVRNFQQLEKGLSEIRRVLKPGGKLVVLEFSKPKMPGVKSMYNLYMKVICPNLGKLFSKNRNAYKYLDESIQHFPEGKNFTNILDNLGYTNTYCKPLSLGICSIYCGTK